MVGNIGPGFAGIAAAQAHLHVTKMTFSHPAVLMILDKAAMARFFYVVRAQDLPDVFPSVFGFVNVWPQSR